MRAKIVVVCLLISYAFITASLVPAWQNNMTLWSRVLVFSPSYPRAAVNLGQALAVDGRLPEAVMVWEQTRVISKAARMPERERQLVLLVVELNLINFFAAKNVYDSRLPELLTDAWERAPYVFNAPGVEATGEWRIIKH